MTQFCKHITFAGDEWPYGMSKTNPVKEDNEFDIEDDNFQYHSLGICLCDIKILKID